MIRIALRLGGAAFFSVVALVALFLVNAWSGDDVGAIHGLPLDHFKCYLTTGRPANDAVVLRDQFDAAAGIVEDAKVRRPVRFCNPVEKTDAAGVVTPISDPNAHLKLYLIDTQPAPSRTVIVSNQFGPNQALTVSNPEVLAVPTRKLPFPPPAPNALDHFKCYRAEGASINTAVQLKDQFHTESDVRVAQPFGFCNPVEKTHAGVVTPINHPLDHLVCYVIAGTPFTTVVRVQNQFGRERLKLSTADLLCVPSQKLTGPVP